MQALTGAALTDKARAVAIRPMVRITNDDLTAASLRMTIIIAKMSDMLLDSRVGVVGCRLGRVGLGAAEEETKGTAEVESKDLVSTPVALTTPKKAP